MKIDANFGREDSQITFNLEVTNLSDIAITELEVQIKPNFFNLLIERLTNGVTLFPNQTQRFAFKVNSQGTGDLNYPSVPLIFVMGVKTSLDIFYFNAPCMFHCLLVNFKNRILRKLKFFRLRMGFWKKRISDCCGNRFQKRMNCFMK